jgi:hypothetical protein
MQYTRVLISLDYTYTIIYFNVSRPEIRLELKIDFRLLIYTPYLVLINLIQESP